MIVDAEILEDRDDDAAWDSIPALEALK